MSTSNPPRLRAGSALPQALRSALRALPTQEPSDTQLEVLRARVGLNATETPVVAHATWPALAAQRQRQKARKLGRTVAALVLFPVAAAAAVGTVIEVAQRRLAPSVAASVTATAAKPMHGPNRSAFTAPVPSAPESSEPLPSAAPPPYSVSPAVAAVHTASSASSAPLEGVPVPRRLPTASDAVASAAFAATTSSGAPAVSEVELLQRANAALKTQPATALALAAQHRQAFPHGNLAQERDAIAIKAWLALGETGRARSALISFERSYPHSAYALELRQLLP
jgi:hypothetical protein